MKKLILPLLFVFTSSAYGWTLNNNFGASFKDNNVKVYVDENTVCPTNRLTPDELESLIKPAVDDFWNEVPTSNLRLKASGFSEGIFTMNEGRLCSPTDDDCIAAGEAAGSDGTPEDGLIPAVDNIIIACNSNPLNFGGGNVLAVTIPNKFSGKKIKGAVILINDASSSFGNLSRSDQIGVISHEIGHAIGLGHSKDSAALMYYRTVDQRSKLGKDDMKGVSYLYPIKGDLYGLSEDGLLGSCGTINLDNKNPPGNSPFLIMGFTLGGLILLYEIIRYLRSKTRSSF